MLFPSNSPWRGCGANFAQPVGEEDERAAQSLVENVHRFNCRIANPPLADIVYRSSNEEQDVTRQVFRWDMTPYQQVFQNGFHARRQEGTPDNIYFDLEQYVRLGGRPLDSTRPTNHAFISTTVDSNWRPCPVLQPGIEIPVYRYEIYAPGGIWVAQTLMNRYQNPAQDEVCFVAGVAPQYVRSAQLFIASRDAGSMYVRWRRADNIIRVNWHFNPQSHPSRLLNIQKPVFDYVDDSGTHTPLTVAIYMPQLPQSESKGRREQRRVSNDTSYWYVDKVADTASYISAAFRSSRKNEAYLFMKNEYILINYSPGTPKDKILNGPLLICDGYPSLIGTAFGEHGIDCAFDSHHGNEAFIFSGNLCAYIDYAPKTTNDRILKGPMTITAMFPFFNLTVFENGIDAAFRATARNEAYLFKGNQYALINYDSKNLITIRNIAKGFYSLENTIFATGIDAAFASHRKNEAYLFKGDKYALINFAPRSTDDYIIGGVKLILSSWPTLHRSILSRKNRGLDVHGHRNRTQLD